MKWQGVGGVAEKKADNRIIRELSNRWLALRLAIFGRTHQYAEILALRRFLAGFDIDCVLDVGANQGQYARMLRTDCRFAGHIFSFEPNPDIFAQLAKKAEGDPRWHVHNSALSDFDGTSPFNVMAADQFSSLERPAEGQDEIFDSRNKVLRTVEIQCRRVDTMLPELRAAHAFSAPFLKMDTQGHDLSVCEGAGAVLAEFVGVQSELGVRPIYESAPDYREMIDWLTARGFAVNAMFANNKGHFPLLVEMDGIFVNGGHLESA